MYDPIGLISAWTIKFKLLLKRLVNPAGQRLDWDDEIDPKLKEDWMTLIVETLNMGTLEFPRAFRPLGEIESAILVGFWDGALEAWGCMVYCRVEMSDGRIEVCLVSAKARTSPASGTSVPKVEVSALLDLSRLMKTVVRSSSVKIDSVVLLGDSECSIAMMRKSGSILAPFFCNRIGEIRSNLEEIEKTTKVEPLQHSGASKPE